MKIILAKLLSLLILITAAPVAPAQEPVNKVKLAAEVRAEFLHAWNGYKKYAWGHEI